jgi:hypothetical protein
MTASKAKVRNEKFLSGDRIPDLTR